MVCSLEFAMGRTAVIINVAKQHLIDPDRWRGALERGAITIIALKEKFKIAVEVLKSTYNNPEAFADLDERFWTPPKVLQARDAMNQHRWELFRTLSGDRQA
jgi:lactate dehydrogenase-like 2-hydroxyacid dehydrogenase